MDERCRFAHAKLLAGICPWCRRSVVAGQVQDPAELIASLFFRDRAQGQSLQLLVEQQGVLAVDEAVKIVELVAKRLAEIHQSIKLLGKLSPGQVFIHGDCVCITMDANSLQTKFSLEGVDDSGEMLAIADYLAPEQALESHRADKRADIYSFGCMMYFLLTGHPPFTGGSISERLLRHQVESPPSILTERPDAPPKLVQICEKMMAKAPSDRFQSSTEFLAALDSLKEDYL